MSRREIVQLDPEKVNELFKAFRHVYGRAGIARQNFSCCMGCGCSEIDAAFEKNGHREDGAYMFYHRQDTQNCWGGGRWNDHGTGRLFLCYGVSSERSVRTTKDVGNKIVELARKIGLKVEWDGETSSRIVITSYVFGKPGWDAPTAVEGSFSKPSFSSNLL